MNGKFSTNAEDNTFRLPFLYVALQLEKFEIDTQQEKLLFVELFTIDSKVSTKMNVLSCHHEFVADIKVESFLLLLSVGAQSVEYTIQN